ncbi:MAG: hypothetical protein HY707_03125 [Ignavibacteriae bacterium]|nr:hypothetical protein [Ignavibacteriota bacterium]
MKLFSLINAVIVISLILSQSSYSLPRFALMTGSKCGTCHINPTGGQMRNEYGVNFSMDAVPLRATKEDDFSFDAKVTDNISLGADYRSQFMYDQKSKTSTFQSMTTTLYGAAQLTKKITFYFKHDIVNGTYNGLFGGIYNGTEVFGIARVLPQGWYIKGGSFLPDYGWRLDDHTAYTRGGDLGFTGAGFHPGLLFIPNYKDIGAEIGGYIQNLLITAGVFNGTGHSTPIDFSKQKAYSAKLEYMDKLGSINCRVGVSGYGYKSFKMGGVTVGLATANSVIVILGEIDWTHHYLAGSTVLEGVHTMAALAELDYRIIQGLWFTGKFDMFDPLRGVKDNDMSPSTNSLKRITIGLEIFPYSFVEVRPQFRLTLEKPSIDDNNVGLVQVHLWF